MSSQQQDQEKTGWLSKKKRGIVKTWKKGWWILTSFSLQEYNSKDELSVMKSELILMDIETVAPEGKDSFIITMKTGELIHLKADDYNEREIWLDLLESRYRTRSKDTTGSLYPVDYYSLPGREKGSISVRDKSNSTASDATTLPPRFSSNLKATSRVLSTQEIIDKQERFMGKARSLALSISRENQISSKRKVGYTPMLNEKMNHRVMVVPSLHSLEIEQSRYEKTPQVNQLLLDIVIKELSAHLANEIRPQSIVDLMFSDLISKDVNVVTQGEATDRMFVIENGIVGVYSQDFVDSPPELEIEKKRGECIGALSFLYNQPGPFTIKTHSECILWALPKLKFHEFIANATKKAVQRKVRLLERIPLIAENLDGNLLHQLADEMEYEEFKEGDILIRTGEDLKKVIIFAEGTAKSEDTRESSSPIHLKDGDVFGEWALLDIGSKSEASLIVTSTKLIVLTLIVQSVEEFLGPLREFVLNKYHERFQEEFLIPYFEEDEQVEKVNQEQEDDDLTDNGEENVEVSHHQLNSEKSLRSARRLVESSRQLNEKSRRYINDEETVIAMATNQAKQRFLSTNDDDKQQDERTSPTKQLSPSPKSSASNVADKRSRAPSNRRFFGEDELETSSNNSSPRKMTSKSPTSSPAHKATMISPRRTTQLLQGSHRELMNDTLRKGTIRILMNTEGEKEEVSEDNLKIELNKLENEAIAKETKAAKTRLASTYHRPPTPTNLGEDDEEGKENLDKPFEVLPPPRSDLVLSSLKFCSLLGKGFFGSVHLVQLIDKPQEKYALKVLTGNYITENGWERMIENERDAMLELTNTKCPFLLQILNYFGDAKNVYFLLELCEGGNLYQISKLSRSSQLSEEFSRFYFGCVVLGLETMHEHEIVYRDLKPENLIISRNGYCKIADFGLAKKTLRTFTFCGTPDYIAPETILNHGHGVAVDWWAAGVLLFEMLCGICPFIGTEPMEIYEKTLSHEYNNELNYSKSTELSMEVKDMIQKFLHPKKNKRLGVRYPGIDGIKNHGFFTGFKWDLLEDLQMPAPILPQIEQHVSENVEYKPKLFAAPDEMSGWTRKFGQPVVCLN